MNPAAPLLFWHTPARLPICKAISTVVGVHRAGWCRRSRRTKDWGSWLRRRSRRTKDWGSWLRRRCGWAPAVVDSATPLFLVRMPSVFCIHSAIERVDWPGRCRMGGWHDVRRWRRCGRWRGRRRGRWRGWNRHLLLWQSRDLPCRGAAPAHGAATEILLCLGPRRFPHRKSSITIERERCGPQSRQQPSKEREQQQQTQQTTTGDDASEISPGSNRVKITAGPDVLVSRLLYEPSLARSHVRHST